MKNKNKIGIMQGRTIPSENNNIQYFPFKSWKKEFPILMDLGIYKLQWIYENSKDTLNPIFNNKFLKKKKLLFEKYNIQIDSIFADEFIKKPIFLNSKFNPLNFNKLIDLIEISSKLKIKYIILPLVDKSSVREYNYDYIITSLIEKVLGYLKKENMELHLETDIENKKIYKIIKKTNSDKNIKINFDSGNTISLGYNIKKEIEDANYMIGSVHIKDRVINGTTVPLGYGDVDFEQFFKSLKDINYERDLILQAARIKSVNDKKLISKYLNFINDYL